jgi:hypothetical protein
MSNLLTSLYRRVITGSPYLAKQSLLKKYSGVVLKEQINSYEADDVSQGVWDSLESKYFYITSSGGQISKKGETGDIKGHRGEVSTIINLLKLYNRAEYQELVRLDSQDRLEEFLQIIRKYTSPSDTTPYDINIDGRKYEVKEAGIKIGKRGAQKGEEVGETVRLGVEGKTEAGNLISNLKTLNPIILAFEKIPNPEKYLPKELIEKILFFTSGRKIKGGKKPAYNNIQSGEITKSLVSFLRELAGTVENYLNTTNIAAKEPLSPTAQKIKDIYNDYLIKQQRTDLEVKDIDARTIDNKAKEIIDKDFKKNPVDEFNEACQSSIYRSLEVFDKNYTNYFTPETEESEKLLRRIFPNIGAFIVDETGWIYAGINNLSYIMTPSHISAATIKIQRIYSR